MYFKLTTVGTIAWYGGSGTGIYRVYIDADQSPTTGFQVGGIGADYLIEQNIGYAPKLWSYSGTGGDWTWTFQKRVDYIFNPGGDTKIIYIVPKSDFTTQSLGSSITDVGQTGQGINNLDITGSLVEPVPEYSILLSFAVLIAVAVSVVLYRRRG